jgi:hypothetical protein
MNFLNLFHVIPVEEFLMWNDMEPLGVMINEVEVPVKHLRTLPIRYSKTEFFCESQEKPAEEVEVANNRMMDTRGKIQERFFGHFNMFF